MKALPQAIAGAHFHSGIMAGKLNGVMPATTPSGWRTRIEIDAGTGAFAVLAFHQMRDAAGELDHLQPALDVAAWRPRTVLPCSDESSLARSSYSFCDQLQELEHHARAALRIGRGPARLRGLRHWRWPARPRRAWRARPWPAPRRYSGSNTSPKRPEVPLTVLPPMKWPISRMAVLLLVRWPLPRRLVPCLAIFCSFRGRSRRSRPASR